MKRNRVIHVRLADGEYEQLRLAAARAGRTVSDYSRYVLVGPKFLEVQGEQGEQAGGDGRKSGVAKTRRGADKAQAGQAGGEARREVVPISREQTAGRKKAGR